MYSGNHRYSASIRSIASRARTAVSFGTVILGLSVTSASRTCARVVFFMFTQTAFSESG